MLKFRQIIQSKDITPISEIGSGPGYFLHVGRNEGRVFIVRVFNKSPTARQVSEVGINSTATHWVKQLESTVAFSKGLMCV
jgi:hypothetical protein